MSITIILILVAIALAGIVHVLHRNQQKEKADAAERANPLPPLERSLLDNADAGSDEHDEFQLTPPRQHSDASSSKKTRSAATIPAAPRVSAHSSADWQAACKELRNTHLYDEALALCEENMPQLPAFRQACLVLRAKIRSQKSANAPEVETSLRQLHKLAAIAAFFHDKNNELPALLSPSRLKQTAPTQWASISSDYEQVGYQHLALLTATDRKMLVAAFGEPSNHAHMRTLNELAWQEIQQ